MEANSVEDWSPGRQAAAWGVHLYTAMGLPLAFISAVAALHGNARTFFLSQWLACVIDATDGMLARRIRVRDVLPNFDGRKLDDIVDFLNFTFLPVLALPGLHLLPQDQVWFVVFPLMASAYGFCQEKAKTQESFVGFPSYWNIVVLYLYVLQATLWTVLTVLLVLSVLTFVPLHYIYPSKAKLWRPITVVGGILWTIALVPVCLAPDAAWVKNIAWWSLLYPVYYTVASLVHHRKYAHTQTAVTT